MHFRCFLNSLFICIHDCITAVSSHVKQVLSVLPSSFRSHTRSVLSRDADTRTRLPSGAKVRSRTMSVWSIRFSKSLPVRRRRYKKHKYSLKLYSLVSFHNLAGSHAQIWREFCKNIDGVNSIAWFKESGEKIQTKTHKEEEYDYREKNPNAIKKKQQQKKTPNT